MSAEEYKKFLWTLLRKEAVKDSAITPTSRPKKYTEMVGKKNTGETSYQRSIISAGTHNLATLGAISWLDIELPVVFGVSPRRSSLDLLGRDKNGNLVLCELKYDKPERVHKQNNKPRTDNPAYALRELLTYYYYAIENSTRLKTDKIWHSNSHPDKWDWDLCQNPEKIILVVAANDAYWKNWRAYTPKKGIGWQEIITEIKAVTKVCPDHPLIKFYCTPAQEKEFSEQANSPETQGHKRYRPQSLIGDWTEIEELK